MRTVFILGAGASHPYGLPLGYRLVKDILDVLSTRKENFVHWGKDDREINRFKRAIEDSVPNAIDDLIVQRSEFLEIGRLAIAQALVQYEREEELFRRGNEDNWYSYFFEHLKRLPGPVPNEQYSFITFNYDRSLEYYLFKASNGFYGNTEPERVRAILQIPILHVHGQLGRLPSQGGDSPYEPTNDRSRIIRMSGHLRLIHDAGDNTFMATAQTLIQKAERIWFLGFGYHESNLKKLEFDQNSQKCNDKVGTAVGLKAAEIRRIQDNHRISLDTHGRTIVDFFREAYPLA